MAASRLWCRGDATVCGDVVVVGCAKSSGDAIVFDRSCDRRVCALACLPRVERVRRRAPRGVRGHVAGAMYIFQASHCAARVNQMPLRSGNSLPGRVKAVNRSAPVEPRRCQCRSAQSPSHLPRSRRRPRHSDGKSSHARTRMLLPPSKEHATR